jgi:uncharacterized DUF497 family protein
MLELYFEWDPEKAGRNRRLHGIDFEDAKYVFHDPRRIIIPDTTHGGTGEERWNVLGLVEKLLFVVFCEKKDVIRIISARTATKKEEEVYNEGNIGT